jgi:hypothetical protein
MGGIQIVTPQLSVATEWLHLLYRVERHEGLKVRIRRTSQARGLTSGMKSVSTAFIDLKEFHTA